jgi:surface antigen
MIDERSRQPLMLCRRVLTVLLIGACLSQSAFAQVNPFRRSRGTPLNSADIQALTDATNRLLDNPDLTSGASETWNNPQSGASGTVTAGNTLQRHGLACRVLLYENTVPGPTPERKANLTWCKTKDGWKIAS